MRLFAKFCPSPKEGKVIRRHAEAALKPYHLIGENSVQSVVLERNHPIQTLELIRSHGAIDD